MPQSSFASRVTTALFDQTFSGIYQLSPFDWALLIPYFAILIVLSVYGLHRYETMRQVLQVSQELPPPPRSNSSNCQSHHPAAAVQRALRGGAADRRSQQDRVSQGTAADPGARRFHRRHASVRSAVQSTRRRVSIEYHHRTNRHGYKAGALQEGLETATGELVAIFDADFIPPADFLTRTVHFFADPGVGVVQTRWSYLNRDYNFLTEVEAMLLDGHFILEHGARSRAGYFFNFNGTAGILRRAMIDDAGGWQHDTLTEDSDLSYRAQLKGWRFVYLPGLDCPSELPVEMHGFQVQQSRWAKGLTQVREETAARDSAAPSSPSA